MKRLGLFAIFCLLVGCSKESQGSDTTAISKPTTTPTNEPIQAGQAASGKEDVPLAAQGPGTPGNETPAGTP